MRIPAVSGMVSYLGLNQARAIWWSDGTLTRPTKPGRVTHTGTPLDGADGAISLLITSLSTDVAIKVNSSQCY